MLIAPILVLNVKNDTLKGMDISYGKGEEKVDVHEKLAAEVYGVGEVNKFSSWGLRARAWVRRFGAEENGIERIPPEARIKQNPLGLSIVLRLLMRPILLFH